MGKKKYSDMVYNMNINRKMRKKFLTICMETPIIK